MSFKILSLDGGGIRGILPGLILVALEEKLQHKTGNPDARIGDYFDMVAGTSTGAILAAALICPGDNNKPKFTAQQAVDVYLNDGKKIFKVSFIRRLITFWGLFDEKFSAQALEQVLLKAFGNTKLSELLKRTCFVSYDINKRKPILFCQKDRLKPNKDFLVRDLLRASTAAPTFFETVQIQSLGSTFEKFDLVDGAMVANNPTLCAYSEALKIDGVNGLKDMMIFSLGTGLELKSYSYSTAKNWGIISWALPSLDLALEGGPQMTEYHMGKIASTVENSKYHRIQPSLYGAASEMDDASDYNIEKLKNAGIKNCQKYDQKLDEIVNELIHDTVS